MVAFPANMADIPISRYIVEWGIYGGSMSRLFFKKEIWISLYNYKILNSNYARHHPENSQQKLMEVSLLNLEERYQSKLEPELTR